MAPSPSSHDASAFKVSDETTPLLAGLESAPLAVPVDRITEAAGHGAANPDEEEEEDDEDEDKPLPKKQIFLLCYTSVVEPIAFFSIFPYINFMIEQVGGVHKEDVGFYSGLIESLFSATQMCVMIFWGRVCIFPVELHKFNNCSRLPINGEENLSSSPH